MRILCVDPLIFEKKRLSIELQRFPHVCKLGKQRRNLKYKDISITLSYLHRYSITLPSFT